MALSLLLTLPQVVIYAWAVSSTVCLGRSGWYIGVSLILSGAVYVLTRRLPGAMLYAAAVGHLALGAVLPIPFTREKRSVTVICALFYMLLMLLMEALVMAAWVVWFHQPLTRVEEDPRLLITMKLLCLFLLMAVIIPARSLLRRQIKPAAGTGWGVLLIMLPLGQAIVLNILLYALTDPVEGRWRWALMVLGAAVTCVADLVFFVSWFRLRRIQLLREQLRLTEQQLENQLHYYERMQASIAEINYVRHDMNNQLQTAYTLLSGGQTEEARRQLDALHRQLCGRVGTVYCANLVADAVLLEKAELCRRLGIRLSIEAALPAEFSVEGIHLCSVLANLLDNAVEGCRGCRDAWIALEARLRAGCLTVVCRNCVGERGRRQREPAGDIPLHGLGLPILRRLAEAYHGDVQTSREGRVFTAVVLLPVPEAEKRGEGECAN